MGFGMWEGTVPEFPGAPVLREAALKIVSYPPHDGSGYCDSTISDNYICAFTPPDGMVPGCDSPSACNYDSTANYSDGSCILAAYYV